jgi:hypothetical protein
LNLGILDAIYFSQISFRSSRGFAIIIKQETLPIKSGKQFYACIHEFPLNIYKVKQKGRLYG